MTSDRSANFDRLASVYDRLAGIVFGDTLRIAQTRGFEHLPANSKIAIFGGGSGSILEDLLATGNRFGRIYYIDASEQMVAQAATRLHGMPNQTIEEVVQFFPQPAEDWCVERNGSLDAVITPFFLDCFEGPELQAMIARIGSLLRQGGQWLATDFVTSPKLSHRLLMATMFQFFRISCGLRSSRLEPYFHLLASGGLQALEKHEFKTIAGPVRSQRFERASNFGVDSGIALR